MRKLFNLTTKTEPLSDTNIRTTLKNWAAASPLPQGVRFQMLSRAESQSVAPNFFTYIWDWLRMLYEPYLNPTRHHNQIVMSNNFAIYQSAMLITNYSHSPFQKGVGVEFGFIHRIDLLTRYQTNWLTSKQL